MPVEERVLPHNLDAERSILGAALIDHRVLDLVADILPADRFFRKAHEKIYAAMVALYARGEGLDFTTIVSELKRRKDLEEVGGPAYIASLSNGVPRGTNVEHYARIVRDTHAQREVIRLANRLLAKAYEYGSDVGELVNEAEMGLLDVSRQAVPGDLKSAEDMTREIFPVLEALQQAGRPVTGISTGFGTLDGYTRGLQNGNLIILGGRPGHGKSSLVLQIALDVAEHVPVAFFSVEMSQQEQMFRILAALGRVDGHRLQCGQLLMHEFAPVSHALEDFSRRRFWHDETGSLSALQIRSRARRLKAKHGLGLIVVDYLQLLNHPKADSREERVASTGRLLKQMARELNVPVLALSQLARKDDRGDRRPQLSDLRESGALEQDADVVFLIHRPAEKSNGGVTEVLPVELIIAKQRNGPTTSVDLKWIGEQYRFGELETRQ